MASPDHPAEGTFSVDFDEVTRIFEELKPVVSRVVEVQDFVQLVQTATNRIFLKYFEFPGSRLYKPEELRLLVQHVMDCINNITPSQIPYESISIDGKWILYPKNKDAPKDPKPN